MANKCQCVCARCVEARVNNRSTHTSASRCPSAQDSGRDSTRRQPVRAAPVVLGGSISGVTHRRGGSVRGSWWGEGEVAPELSQAGYSRHTAERCVAEIG